jgi:hypothetical protein
MAAASTWDESARAAVATRAATENDLTMMVIAGVKVVVVWCG